MIVARGGADEINARGGNDKVCSGRGADLVAGGKGGDVLSAGPANDLVAGEAGEDIINGEKGRDTLSGGWDDDQLTGSSKNDTLLGGDGIDYARFDYSGEAVSVNLTKYEATGQGVDELADIEGVFGSAHSDRIVGDRAANFLIGQAGDDVILGMGGDDALNGGAGEDSCRSQTPAIRSRFVCNQELLLGEDEDTVVQFERVYGTDHGDVLTGGPEDEHLFGGPGPDRLVGSDGDDLLSGGAGDGHGGLRPSQNRRRGPARQGAGYRSRPGQALHDRVRARLPLRGPSQGRRKEELTPGQRGSRQESVAVVRTTSSPEDPGRILCGVETEKTASSDPRTPMNCSETRLRIAWSVARGPTYSRAASTPITVARGVAPGANAPARISEWVHPQHSSRKIKVAKSRIRPGYPSTAPPLRLG